MAKILAIIADTVTFQVVQELLGQEGHQVKVVSDDQEGLDWARELSPDAIICDGDFASNQLFGGVPAGESRSRIGGSLFYSADNTGAI
ncbi:hypothetical protein [Microcoleus vaginatus]|uniref:hypothetical protein n=1 Tax=Microcoleus vaginatus TaxID=119532 RepID=UPI00403FBA38